LAFWEFKAAFYKRADAELAQRELRAIFWSLTKVEKPGMGVKLKSNSQTAGSSKHKYAAGSR